MVTPCQTNVDSGAKVCKTNAPRPGMYCKACRERMMGNGTWTNAHSKRWKEFNAVNRRKHRVRAYYARFRLANEEAKEEKAADRGRQQTNDRDNRARARQRHNDALKLDADKEKEQNYEKPKLDPVKWEAPEQQKAEHEQKKRKRTLTDVNDDEDDNDSDAPPALAQTAIPGDNVVVIVISDDDDGAGADSSGSSVEGIEFVYSDKE